jgi:hypothetical protein
MLTQNNDFAEGILIGLLILLLISISVLLLGVGFFCFIIM